jgi:hypothetical protein
MATPCHTPIPPCRPDAAVAAAGGRGSWIIVEESELDLHADPATDAVPVLNGHLEDEVDNVSEGYGGSIAEDDPVENVAEEIHVTSSVHISSNVSMERLDSIIISGSTTTGESHDQADHVKK